MCAVVIGKMTDYRSVAGNRLIVNHQTDWKPAGTGIILPNNKDPISDKMAPDINTSALLDTHTKRRNQRAKIYERVYRKCCQRIRHTNDILYAKECIFNVPEVQLWGGIPRYQVNAVLGYIMLRLKQKGFEVRLFPPNGILINWAKVVSGDTADKAESSFTLRYQLDEVNTAVPKLDHVASVQERMIHEGCQGDCCNDPNRPPKVINRKQQLELERRKQQIEIDRLIERKDKGGIRR